MQLEYLPEQVFCVGSERLLTQLNLRKNCLKHKPPTEVHFERIGYMTEIVKLTFFQDSFTVGWLDDLPRLESLRSLNLADNDLRSCPAALFQLNALTELVLSGNKLSELPAAIGKLRKLVLCTVWYWNFQNHSNLLTMHLEEPLLARWVGDGLEAKTESLYPRVF